MGKDKFYEKLQGRLRWLLKKETHWLPTLSNLSALLFEEMDRLNWAGFYLFNGEELILGPFQGRPACTRIKPEAGVCGASFSQGEALVVPDVEKFPGHIACDSASRSEIVLPMKLENDIIGVLDMDSPHLNRFDLQDKEGLEELLFVLMRNVDWGSKSI